MSAWIRAPLSYLKCPNVTRRWAPLIIIPQVWGGEDRFYLPYEISSTMDGKHRLHGWKLGWWVWSSHPSTWRLYGHCKRIPREDWWRHFFIKLQTTWLCSQKERNMWLIIHLLELVMTHNQSACEWKNGYMDDTRPSMDVKFGQILITLMLSWMRDQFWVTSQTTYGPCKQWPNNMWHIIHLLEFLDFESYLYRIIFVNKISVYSGEWYRPCMDVKLWRVLLTFYTLGWRGGFFKLT